MAQPPRAFLDEPVDPEGGEGRRGEGSPRQLRHVCQTWIGKAGRTLAEGQVTLGPFPLWVSSPTLSPQGSLSAWRGQISWLGYWLGALACGRVVGGLHSPLGPGSPSSPVGPRYPGGPRAPG